MDVTEQPGEQSDGRAERSEGNGVVAVFDARLFAQSSAMAVGVLTAALSKTSTITFVLAMMLIAFAKMGD